MAKMIKITGYLITDDNDIDEKEIALAAKEILSSKFDCIGKPFTTEVVEIKEWNDNHELNHIDCTAAVCEEYFTKKKFEVGFMYDGVYKRTNIKSNNIEEVKNELCRKMERNGWNTSKE